MNITSSRSQAPPGNALSCRLRLLFTSIALALPSLPVPDSALSADQSPDVLAKSPVWQMPKPDDVRSQVFQWLAEKKPGDEVLAQAKDLWSQPAESLSGVEVLDRVVRTIAMADQNAGRLLELCSKPRSELVLPSQPWLTDPATSPLVSNNFRLDYGRWLAHERMFDEAMEQLAGLEPKDVVDPASLLFYQGVVCHRLMDRENGMKAIDRLLDGAAQSPKRYAAVAKLMKEDLKDLEEDTLDHIARRMEDIERRLELGRAGPKVRKVEDGVIESLDKLIKKLEEQQQQQQQQASSGRGSMQPSSPAPDSQIMGGKGKGEVTKRDVGHESGWGDLPPKQREEAMQQIGRDFPAHYRDAIEQYFRRLATDKGE
ncbi:MAG: hypothetical protein HUU20_01015 [Pirellulales bacterium]|nr:hypothetical protein [Pirellulales bacterium]